MVAANDDPAFGASLTSAQVVSDAARRHSETSAPAAAPGTPVSTAALMTPARLPHAPGTTTVVTGAVVAGATVVIGAVAAGAGATVVAVAADPPVPPRSAVDPLPESSPGATATATPTPTAASTRIRSIQRVRVIRQVSRATGRGSWHPHYIPGIAGSPLSSPAAAPPSDLELALALADTADALTMARFRATDLVVETKPDTTPVTEADRAVEEMLRARLAAARPDDSILGEEFGTLVGAEGDGARRWVVDPIDGTMGYARGVPVWATLLALVEDGVVTTGVVSAPALGTRWWAARGEGAWRNGDRVSVSRVGAIEDAQLSYSSVKYFEQAGIGDEFLTLAGRCWRSRAFGDFWSHMLVADGSVDIAIEVGGLAPWDLAALQVVVEEAGGRFTDRAGVAGFDRGEAVTTNGLLHDEVLAALSPGPGRG